MRVRIWFLLLQIAAFPFVVQGQQSRGSLTEAQQLGRRVFQQRCAVCHTRPTLAIKRPWGPVLTKDVMEGNEDGAREMILKGRPGYMPGFHMVSKAARSTLSLNISRPDQPYSTRGIISRIAIIAAVKRKKSKIHEMPFSLPEALSR